MPASRVFWRQIALLVLDLPSRPETCTFGTVKQTHPVKRELFLGRLDFLCGCLTFITCAFQTNLMGTSLLKTTVWIFSLCVLPYIAFTLSIMSKPAVKYELWGKRVELDIPQELFPTHEELQALEAALPGCEHGWFESNGFHLHYRKFMPADGKPKGVIVYQHGILGQTGNAFVLKTGRKISGSLLSDALTKAGYSLYGLDMRGHGFSEGPRWYVPDWKVNRDDLDNFARLVASQHPGIPLFLFGESYGSTIVLHLARKWQDGENAPEGFSGIVVNAPAIVSEMPPYPIVFTLRYILAPLFPRWVPFFMPNPVSADRVWRDEEVRDLHTDPRWLEMGLDGGGRPFRLGTAVSLTNALEEVRDSTIPGLNVPFCAIHGAKDVAVPIEGVDLLEEMAATPIEDRAVYRLPEAYHDLLGDPTAEETMSYILKFVDERM